MCFLRAMFRVTRRLPRYPKIWPCRLRQCLQSMSPFTDADPDTDADTELTYCRPVMPTTPTYPNPEYPPIMGLPLPPPSFIPVFTDALSPPPAFHATPSSTATFCDPASSLAYTFLPPPPPAAAYPVQPLPLHETPGTSIRMNGHGHGQHTYPGKTYNSSYSHSHSYTPRASRRTILIHNLTSSHRSTPTQNDLLALFSEVGIIEQCQILDNTTTNPNPNPTTSTPRYKKLSAKITFATAEHAKRAVALFDNIPFMGSKRIRVRIDRGMNPNPNPNPVSGFGSGYNNNNNSSPSKPTNGGGDEGISNPSPKPTAATAAEKPKVVVDRCQPLVVNGSGIGRDVPCYC